MITEQKRANLRTLADFLPTVPQDEFDMYSFRSDSDDYAADPAVPPCGTTACAAGWGPVALGHTGTIEDIAGWIFEHLIDIRTDAQEWKWCFSEWWGTGPSLVGAVDNTPTGAALRIKHFLDHGLPADWHGQMLGTAPYMFADQVAT